MTADKNLKYEVLEENKDDDDILIYVTQTDLKDK